MTIGNPTLDQDFLDAVEMAVRAHDGQQRKGAPYPVPYAEHLLGVAALLLANGSPKSHVIAGLLHDMCEDQGGQEAIARIRTRFGEEVAALVLACSDTDQSPKPPWKERKDAKIASLRAHGSPAADVILCDQIHNVQSTVDRVHRDGHMDWSAFKAGRDGYLWYVKSVHAALAAHGAEPFLAAKLGRTIAELERVLDVTSRTAALR
jgi:(p)ppGpp synthase/HD superfamily hydrolase